MPAAGSLSVESDLAIGALLASFPRAAFTARACLSFSPVRKKIGPGQTISVGASFATHSSFTRGTSGSPRRCDYDTLSEQAQEIPIADNVYCYSRPVAAVSTVAAISAIATLAACTPVSL
jgi:hypothetical protein